MFGVLHVCMYIHLIVFTTMLVPYTDVPELKCSTPPIYLGQAHDNVLTAVLFLDTERGGARRTSLGAGAN